MREVREVRKYRVAKAARAKPYGWMKEQQKRRHCGVKKKSRPIIKKKQIRNRQLWQLRCWKRPPVALSTFGSKNCKSTSASEHFWKLSCPKSARNCGAKRFQKSKYLTLMVKGCMDCAPCQEWEKRAGFLAVAKPMARVGCLKKIRKDALRVEGERITEDTKRHLYQRC